MGTARGDSALTGARALRCGATHHPNLGRLPAIIHGLSRLIPPIGRNRGDSSRFRATSSIFRASDARVDSLLKQFAQSSQLGANADYVDGLYEQYLASPDSVSPQWKAYFDSFRGRESGDIPHSAIIEAIAIAGRQAARGVATAARPQATIATAPSASSSPPIARVDTWPPASTRSAWRPSPTLRT